MDLTKLKKLVTRALDTKQDEICAHIEKVQDKGRRHGIESVFAKAFEEQLCFTKFQPQTPLSVIRTESYYPGRPGGRLDCYLPSECAAFEYKVVRLPRQHSDSAGGALYDIGQLASDYLRLNRAKRLQAGYVIVFAYGPLVLDVQSPGKLYRAFHNQMFVDLSVARENQQEDLTRDRHWACRKLAWSRPYGGSQPPEWVAATKVKALGAICIDCRL